MRRKQVKQVVFTSYATSLDTWRKAGILQRELRYIELLQKNESIPDAVWIEDP